MGQPTTPLPKIWIELPLRTSVISLRLDDYWFHVPCQRYYLSIFGHDCQSANQPSTVNDHADNHRRNQSNQRTIIMTLRKLKTLMHSTGCLDLTQKESAATIVLLEELSKPIKRQPFAVVLYPCRCTAGPYLSKNPLPMYCPKHKERTSHDTD